MFFVLGILLIGIGCALLFGMATRYGQKAELPPVKVRRAALALIAIGIILVLGSITTKLWHVMP